MIWKSCIFRSGEPYFKSCKVVRNELLESDISGVFPCGEGAGYAGGITSAAVDGIKVAEKIAQKISAGI